MAPKRRIERATDPVRPSPAKQAKLSTTTNGSPAEQSKLSFTSDSKDNDERVPAPTETPKHANFDHSRIAEENGIIQRQFYPPEMSKERCEQYNNNAIPRPIEELEKAIKSTRNDREKVKVGDCVVHWFKRDLRVYDNKALGLASAKAKEAGVPLVCMWILSPQDWQAHSTSAARVDFELRTLEILQKDLEELDVPLYMTTTDKRKDVPSHILKQCEEWGAKHIYCNIEYEVDELRRETKLIEMGLEQGIAFTAVHDDVVVPPGDLVSGTGKVYSVYSPFWRAWVKHIHEKPHLLAEAEKVQKNPASARQKFKDVFGMAIPTAPKVKQFATAEERKKIAGFWPAGEHEAITRLDKFVKNNITKYKDLRNLPNANATSLISPHLSAGTLSIRTAVRAARDASSSKKLDGGSEGTRNWISELAWRDFYKHVLCHWPFVCMGKPFKYEYADIEWEYNDEHFAAWCEGRTGFPIVDAAMRQLKGMSYIHNRCRMIVASFLAKDLLLDWRQGEKFFHENLVDADFASNNGGWGFSASTGVDPQPYFRIFNPLLQSEKFDADGSYIRKWVPELKGVEGKAIHDPYGRGAGKQAEKAGYPKPIVEHAKARQRALERYKGGLGRSTANVGGGVHN